MRSTVTGRYGRMVAFRFSLLVFMPADVAILMIGLSPSGHALRRAQLVGAEPVHQSACVPRDSTQRLRKMTGLSVSETV